MLTALLGLGSGNIFQKYWQYLDGLAHLQPRPVHREFPVPVATEISQSILWTLLLVGAATVISFVVGITLGVLAGWKRGTRLDNLVPATTFLTAMPYFWLALIMLYLFTQGAGTCSRKGRDTTRLDHIGLNGPFIGSAVQHSILPALTIVLSSVGGWLLGMRNMMVVHPVRRLCGRGGGQRAEASGGS